MSSRRLLPDLPVFALESARFLGEAQPLVGLFPPAHRQPRTLAAPEEPDIAREVQPPTR